jgi:hypothetical protein
MKFVGSIPTGCTPMGILTLCQDLRAKGQSQVDMDR